MCIRGTQGGNANFSEAVSFLNLYEVYTTMSSNAALKRSPCPEDSSLKTKTARVNSPIVLGPTPNFRFSTFEELDSFRKRVWGEAVKSGE